MVKVEFYDVIGFSDATVKTYLVYMKCAREATPLQHPTGNHQGRRATKRRREGMILYNLENIYFKSMHMFVFVTHYGRLILKFHKL